MKFVISIFLLGLIGASEGEEILPSEIAPGVPKRKMMEEYLRNLGLEALQRRKAAFEKLADEKFPQWQSQRREFFIRQIGGLPEKRTPLNARVTETLEFDDYWIEKVIFESQPNFHVTGNLYLPKGKGPFPGVIHPTGHSNNAKSRDLYQFASITIARGGCAVLCYDPIGQGERDQVFDENGKPFSSTQQHTFINQGMHLLGANTARTMIWDGTRAIDYLQSRSDIIPDKIGCTGISGGGTNTSYLMALDERIVAAAPGCYLCGFGELLNSIGPQDAEQNIPGQLAFGMDHSDYVLMTLPRPTLIMAATDDYFSIRGAWEIFREGKRIATRMGVPERIDLVEPNTKHGFPVEMRIASSNWMRRWLVGKDDPVGPEPEDMKALSDEELNVLKNGAVLSVEGAKSNFDLTMERCNSFAAAREENARPENAEKLVSIVRELTGAQKIGKRPAPGLKKIDDTHWIIESEPGIFLPARLVVSSKAEVKKRVLVLHTLQPKLDLPDEDIEYLFVDLRGLGETKKGGSLRAFDSFFGPDWKDTSAASLLGKTYVGMRVDDIVQSIRAWQKISGEPNLRPEIIATGEAAIPALHAAVLAPELTGKVRLSHSIDSWIEVVKTPVVRNQQPNLVFGALREYDLPMLRKLLGNRLIFENPVAVDWKGE